MAWDDGIPDSAAYWWPEYARRSPPPKVKRQTPVHDCKPRGGPPGTHNRWRCKVCGRRFKSIPRKKD